MWLMANIWGSAALYRRGCLFMFMKYILSCSSFACTLVCRLCCFSLPASLRQMLPLLGERNVLAPWQMLHKSHQPCE